MPKGYPKTDICMNDLCKLPFQRTGVGHRYCKKCQHRLRKLPTTRSLPGSNRDSGKGVYSKT